MRFAAGTRGHPRRRRGTALVLVIGIAMFVAGAVMVSGWVSGVEARATNTYKQLDQAQFAAESGIQAVAWYANNGKLSGTSGTVTGSINGYTYTASWSIVTSPAIKVDSTGTNGVASWSAHATIYPADRIMPAIATGGNFDNKNIQVVGDLEVGGTYDNSNNNGSLTGNLLYGVSATNTGEVTGYKRKVSFSALDFTALGTTLLANNQQTYVGTQSNKTFDFSVLAGTNKVIYVNGDVKNPTFIGTGTLYVNGNVTVGDFGTASNPINIVATQNATTGNNTIYGTLYVGGDWTRGHIDGTGLVYVAGDTINANSGQANATAFNTASSIPWFDTRMTATGIQIIPTTYESYTAGTFSSPMP